jgi:PPOX class probable F420-dependent enzyme
MANTPPVPPSEVVDLLERPLIAHLCTLGSSGEPHSQPMWYGWDGTSVRMSTTTTRQKYRHATRDPRVALSIHDPDARQRYIEVRGTVTSIDPDPTGEGTKAIGRRYGLSDMEVADRAIRVILTITPARYSTQRIPPRPD